MGKKRDRAGVQRTPREELKRLIYVTSACLESNGQRPTVAAISRHLKYSASSYFRTIVDEMVSENTMLSYSEIMPNGRQRKVYLIPETPLEVAVKNATS